jgi:hypothetical protein
MRQFYQTYLNYKTMKNKYLIIVIAIFLVIISLSFIQSSNPKFYYAYKEKIHLNELDNKLIVRCKQNLKADRTKMSMSLELANKSKK